MSGEQRLLLAFEMSLFARELASELYAGVLSGAVDRQGAECDFATTISWDRANPMAFIDLPVTPT